MMSTSLIDYYAEWHMRKAGLEHHILEIDMYTFSYWDSESDEKPVYCLFHGYGTSTHLQLFGQVKMLSKTHRVILPNLLYFGSEIKGENRYKIEDQVAAMYILLDALKINTLVLGGYSYGGLIAAELAVKMKGKIKMLTIFSSPLKFYKQDDSLHIQLKAPTKNVTDILVPATVEMAAELVKILQYKERYIPKFIINNFYNNLFHDKQNNANYTAVLNELLSNTNVLSMQDYDFKYPVLLIWGANDKLIPNRIGTELNGYFENSELHIIPKAGHLVTLEQREKFNSILHAFLVKGI